jgi:hypothetical protein
VRAFWKGGAACLVFWGGAFLPLTNTPMHNLAPFARLKLSNAEKHLD